MLVEVMVVDGSSDGIVVDVVIICGLQLSMGAPPVDSPKSPIFTLPSADMSICMKVINKIAIDFQSPALMIYLRLEVSDRDESSSENECGPLLSRPGGK